MSTPLWDNENLSLVRYYGGISRGVMYQLTMKHPPPMQTHYDHGYVQMTADDIVSLAAHLLAEGLKLT